VQTFFVVLLLMSAVLTMACTFWRPRSIFTILLMIGLVYFIAISFAVESRDHQVMAVVGCLGILPFVGTFLWGVVRFVQRSDAWVWRSLGVTGAYRLWQKYLISGEEARRYWLMQFLCSALIAVSLSGGLVVRLQREEPRPDASSQSVPTVSDEDRKKNQEEHAFGELAEQATPLVDECRKMGQPADRVALLGKALIMDLKTGKPRTAQGYLPEELRGKPTDPELTLFIVAAEHRTLITAYHLPAAAQEIPGYRVDIDLAIMRWPSKKPLGMVQLKGDDPPENISVRQSVGGQTHPPAVTGWVDAPLAHWVASRPHAGKPDPVGDALALAADVKDKEDAITVRCLPKDDSYVYDAEGSAPKLKGKVLFWDVARDIHAEKANHYVPEKLRGQPSDQELTLFMVTRLEVEVTGRPENGGTIFGTAVIEGFIVYWPKKEAIGPFKLTCENLLGIPGSGFLQPDGQVASEAESGLYDTAAIKLGRWAESLAGR
jgi:hypothetical protein